MGMKPIPGYQGYHVTASGVVWSNRGGTWRKLKATPDEEGYLYVGLTLYGARRDVALHRIVAEVWCPGWHPSLEVHHKDGDPANNAANNLLCVTPAEHCVLHHIWQDPEKVRRERRKANELIASSKPPVKGEPRIRGLLRAIQDTETGLRKRGISL